MKEQIPNPAVQAFIERMGLASETDGMPRIAGRILGYLIVYGGPVSFTELADILQVSRGSISTNARLLGSLGIIELVSFPGDRQNYYQLSDNPGEKIISAALARIKNTERILGSARKTIPESIEGSADRLQQMEQLYGTVGQQLEIALQQLDNG